MGDGEEEEEEVWRDVRGLRPAVYEVWVRAHAAAGAGPASRPLTAAPAQPGRYPAPRSLPPLYTPHYITLHVVDIAVSARISSLGRVVYARRGATVRLRCAAVGTPPLRGRWSPLPTAHTLTDSRDLILHSELAIRDYFDIVIMPLFLKKKLLHGPRCAHLNIQS